MGYPIDTVRVLAWDIFAKRWTLVFNSATAQFPVVFPLDAVDDLYDVTVSPLPTTSTPTPSPLSELVDAQVAPIADQPHGGVDLAFEGVDGFSAVGTQLAGIVHFAEGVAAVEWAYEARDLGTFSVIGRSPNQQLAFEHTEWITPADAECCGVRMFRFVVAKTAEAGGYEYYSVVSDNRSWLGAWIVPEFGRGDRRSGPLDHPWLTRVSRSQAGRHSQGCCRNTTTTRASWSGSDRRAGRAPCGQRGHA